MRGAHQLSGNRENSGDMNAIAATQHWLEQAVIGLNLCPFARAVHVKRQIRWVESEARDAQALSTTWCESCGSWRRLTPRRWTQLC